MFAAGAARLIALRSSSLAKAMPGSNTAIERRLAKLAIGQSKLHAQTQRNHMCTSISAATQKPSVGPDTEADRLVSRRELRDSFNHELQVALDGPEIDSLGIASRHQRMSNR